ncbi:MAG: TolC family protein [Chitinophagales bacterium]
MKCLNKNWQLENVLRTQWTMGNEQLANGNKDKFAYCKLLIANLLKRSFCLLLIASCLLLNRQKATAQDTIPINLETVLKLGGANNLTIQEFKQRQELAAADLSKAKEWWLPDLHAGVQTHQLWGAAMNADGGFFLDVNRDNLWAGLGLDASLDFANGIYKKKAAQLKVSAAEYRTQSERNQALLESIEAYYDFMSAQLYFQAYDQLVEQADTIAQQIGIQVESGIAYESESLLSKSNVNHLKVQMLNAKAEYNRKSARLVKLLNLKPGIKLVSIDTAVSPLNLENGISTVDFDSSYQNRPEIKALEFEEQSLLMEKKTTTTGLLIPELRLNTFGTYFGGLSDDVRAMDPIQNPETNQLYPTGAVNLSLMWQVPLGRLFYGGDLKQYNARIGIQQTKIERQKAEINEEILAAKASISAAQEQMEIAFEGNQFAEEALKQSIQRQKLGTARPFEILQAQEVYIKARLDYIKAVADYNKAQYSYYVALGNDL